MRWGVRKEPDPKKDTRIKQQKTISKSASNVDESKQSYPSPLKKGRERWERQQIANNRINSSFGTAIYRREKGLDVSYSVGDNGSSDGNYYVSTDGGKTYKIYGDDFLKVLTDMGYSKEDAEAMISQYDNNWVERQRIKDMIEEANETETNVSDKYNSKKNTFDGNTAKTKVSEISKNKTWKEKVANGAKKVAETMKKIGKQIVSTAKNIADSGKKFLTKLFNVKKTPTTIYSYGTKTVYAPGDRSLSKAKKKLKKQT